MWRRRRSCRVVHVVVAGGLALAASCAPPRFPRELFTITGEGAEYPVMLSRAPAGREGHKIQSESGTYLHHHQTGRSPGIGGVSYTRSAESEMPASVKLNAQVKRADNWVQIERVEYFSSDFSTYSNRTARRRLTIEGTAYR
jgi:hypothetical protein